MSQNQTDIVDEQIESMSRAEISAWNNFTSVFVTQHPLSLGWEFWGAVATSISGMALAAFRTFQAFYLAASFGQSGTGFPTFEAIVAVVAVEGSVVLFSIRSAKSKNKTNDTWSLLGMIVAFLISTIAGLFQSANILGGSATWFTVPLQWALVMVMGLGATMIAWIGGDLFGVELVKYENSHKMRKASMFKAWKVSQEHSSVVSRKDKRYVESSNESSTGDGKFQESSTKVPDWRKFRPTLDADGLYKLAVMNPDDIRQFASDTGFTYKTISNYRSRARQELGMPEVSEDNNQEILQ